MSLGIIGKKCGMTRIFQDDGTSIPVTVLEVSPNYIVQIKTPETDGYRAVQVTMGTQKVSRVTEPLIGHYKKANVAPGKGLWEFRLEEHEMKIGEQELKVGENLTVNIFKVGQLVDVQGVSKGKGFAGVIKRHHFSSQRASHGNSLSHRVPGSIGQRQTPGRVFKGKRMAGHLGNKNCTIPNQEIIRIEPEKNLLLIKGAMPGASGGYVVVVPAKKNKIKGEK
ncbi:MAG: 50S ribosomal protein L3 [Gammaproteobacteria bacterium]|nr:50S ribosomal protein L3 [Gammaproteobacteria bacterium]